ncbi:MAG TPA: DUF3822 family protein [Haliscomenobacter sp.]|uniref:DUF3822 family protein n=1 Tax=Haliscomenobacter sp. TaxID=2717303 RepID=UPI002C5BC370|nr:DUF3822 family protein [Haliscomenobacter sp.]HOY16661.1 DUF3822 family protein [Haliscomenobacter sp.]
MANLKYDIVEDNYSPHISALCKLSILFGMDSFSYAVVDNQQKIQAYQHYTLERDANGELDWAGFLATLHSPREMLTRNYRSVRAVVASPVFTLVPAQWYRVEEKLTYLQHLTTPSAQTIVQADVIPGYPMNAVYEIPNAAQAWLSNLQPEAEFVHCVSALAPLLRSRLETPHNVAAYFGPNRVFIFYFHEGQLVFCNSFSYQTARDALYFLLLVFDQFRLGTEYTPLWIMGHYTEQGELHRQIKRYIKSLQYVPLPAGFRSGTKLNAIPEHFYVDLVAGI